MALIYEENMIVFSQQAEQLNLFTSQRIWRERAICVGCLLFLTTTALKAAPLLAPQAMAEERHSVRSLVTWM